MNLNEYFSNVKYFKNKIIVISAKDESSKKIRKFVAGENLGLKLNIGHNNSYVAVIDNKRNFIFEKADNKSQDCSYQVKNKYIDIISAGFDSGNKSSIRIGDNEFSNNCRGLNFAIFHYKSLALVDKFFVDSNDDSSLTIRR